jgi:hypothetical protein
MAGLLRPGHFLSCKTPCERVAGQPGEIAAFFAAL